MNDRSHGFLQLSSNRKLAAILLGLVGAIAFAAFARAMHPAELGGGGTVLRTDLLLRSLAPSDTAKLQVQHIELAPNAEAPHHRHNVAILAYVLEGKVQTESEDGSVSTYDVGAAWWQQPGPHVHLVARNASKNARARLLTVFIGEKLPITDAD